MFCPRLVIIYIIEIAAINKTEEKCLEIILRKIITAILDLNIRTEYNSSRNRNWKGSNDVWYYTK